MFKIILKDRSYRMSADAFYSSGMDKMTMKLERGHHPLKDCASDVEAICEDIMRHDQDACFLIGLGRMTASEKKEFAREWCSGSYMFRVSTLEVIAEMEADREAKQHAA